MSRRAQPAIQSQFGPTNSFISLNESTILGAGSVYEAEVETVRYDANKGYVLHTIGSELKGVSLNIFDEIQVKAMELITVSNFTYVLVLCKNDGIKLIKI